MFFLSSTNKASRSKNKLDDIMLSINFHGYEEESPGGLVFCIAASSFVLFFSALHFIIYHIDIRISFQPPREISFVKNGSADWIAWSFQDLVFVMGFFFLPEIAQDGEFHKYLGIR